MVDSLQRFDLVPAVEGGAADRARRVVAEHSSDADDARELLDALGLLSPPVNNPVDKRKAS